MKAASSRFILSILLSKRVEKSDADLYKSCSASLDVSAQCIQPLKNILLEYAALIHYFNPAIQLTNLSDGASLMRQLGTNFAARIGSAMHVDI
ncbi:hypothetical protein HNR39_002233 [Glaciimonas immobilis]|uniref:Uncharacterized protein n=1 Tax=Glaciimonas immobilis TaxID=728004 RepID=A0A840RTN2_9BURK|nr:hypothetical protein [Glaciimonas immobilis]